MLAITVATDDISRLYIHESVLKEEAVRFQLRQEDHSRNEDKRRRGVSDDNKE